MDHIEAILGLVLGVIGLLTTIGGGLAWYSARVKKTYAAERDFQHLKRSYDALTLNVEQVWRHLDERCDRIDLKLSEIAAKQK